MENKIAETLEKLYWEELNKEGITKEDIGLIMLEIEFTPVTPFEGASPCEVKETIGNNYIVMSPTGAITVDEEGLKVMRFRYLQFDPERIGQRNAINNMFK